MAIAPQTSVSVQQGAARDGQLADATFQKDVWSAVSEESSAEIPFGVMVCKGSADDGCLLPANDTDDMLGVVLLDDAYEKDVQLGDTGIKPNMMVNVLRHGRIWVRVEDAVAPGQEVFVRLEDASGSNGYGAAGAENFGAFRGTQDTDCTEISGYARWLSTAGAGELALLEINMTFSNT